MRGGWALVTGALVAGFGAGCGPYDDFYGGGGGGGFFNDSPCSVNEDCVPADCCGQSSRAVNLEMAPSCSGPEQCADSACFLEAYGGCGVPLCNQEGFCQMAISIDCAPAC